MHAREPRAAGRGDARRRASSWPRRSATAARRCVASTPAGTPRARPRGPRILRPPCAPAARMPGTTGPATPQRPADAGPGPSDRARDTGPRAEPRAARRRPRRPRRDSGSARGRRCRTRVRCCDHRRRAATRGGDIRCERRAGPRHGRGSRMPTDRRGRGAGPCPVRAGRTRGRPRPRPVRRSGRAPA